jgi:hypothetical protein
VSDFNAIRSAERDAAARANKLRRMSRKQRAALERAEAAAEAGGSSAGGAGESRGSSVRSDDGGSTSGGATTSATQSGSESDDDDDDVGDDADAEGAAPAARASPAGGSTAADEWRRAAWAARCGLRRWLSEDASTGRRYWLLAGRAGAVQVCADMRLTRVTTFSNVLQLSLAISVRVCACGPAEACAH